MSTNKKYRFSPTTTINKITTKKNPFVISIFGVVVASISHNMYKKGETRT